MAHYPPYTSSLHPTPHRVFPHRTKALQGVILTSHQLVKELIDKTTTKKGLKVVANIINKVYQTGRKAATDFFDTMQIVFDDFLGKWNYTAVPKEAAS